VVIDVNPTNIERLADGAEVLLDGTDNFETRFLINDLAVKTNRPWVYGAVIGATGLCMTVLPRDTPCLRCIFEEAPPPEINPTCDTAGVLAAAVNIVASLQAIETVKLLTGRREEVNRHLVQVDAWSGRVVNLKVQSAYDEGDCVCCKRGDFAYLQGRFAGSTTTLCGRDAVQVSPGGSLRVDFAAIAKKLEPVAAGPVQYNRFLLKAAVDAFEMTLFPDGRAIIKGVKDADRARTLYAKYLGT
jgi:adenylyltransferase/sulfurtransferase